MLCDIELFSVIIPLKKRGIGGNLDSYSVSRAGRHRWHLSCTFNAAMHTSCLLGLGNFNFAAAPRSASTSLSHDWLYYPRCSAEEKIACALSDRCTPEVTPRSYRCRFILGHFNREVKYHHRLSETQCGNYKAKTVLRLAYLTACLHHSIFSIFTNSMGNVDFLFVHTQVIRAKQALDLLSSTWRTCVRVGRRAVGAKLYF